MSDKKRVHNNTFQDILKETASSVASRDGSEVIIFEESDDYADSFGFEWTEYGGDYIDKGWTYKNSKLYLEWYIGVPLEFLKGKVVLELGSGSGRFTEILADYAEEVVTVEMSRAIYCNKALGRDNVTFVKSDINKLPFSSKFDFVLCLGVVQHTKDPVLTIEQLFESAKRDAIVAFNVYPKSGREWRNWKYFWRKIIPRIWTVEKFNDIIKKKGRLFYGLSQGLITLTEKLYVKSILARTPFLYTYDYSKLYPNLSDSVRVECFKCDLIDMLYATYDQPMFAEEVLAPILKLGWIPYSYNLSRNIFRCKKQSGSPQPHGRFTKHGIKFI